MSFIPIDSEARRRATSDHETSFVLEAGAGTGKTTLLVSRIESLLLHRRARLGEIAAVTFSENAATTLKLRLRLRLERARGSGDPAARAAAGDALDQLERAAITTLHAFCAALLSERPLDCGVVPGFRVADEAEADLLFAQAWEEWIAGQLEQGDDAIMAAIDQGIPVVGRSEYEDRLSLRGLARSLIAQRDLTPLVGASQPDASAWRDELAVRAARAAVLLRSAQPSDTLAAGLGRLIAFAAAARPLQGAHLAALREGLPETLTGLTARSGDKGRWTSAEALEEARAIVAWARQSVEEWDEARGAALHARLIGALCGVGTVYAAKKAEQGVLDFLDLLLKAKEALERRPSVRQYFASRYPYVIVDEFQDTDALQVRIAELLTGLRPGALVVVGDPKQSIYRFRRADVRLLTRLADLARQRPGHAVLSLTQNFRSRPAILRFVNRVFAALIERSDEAGQAAYEPIEPVPGLPEDPSVIALRFEAQYASGEDLLRAESKAVARLLSGVARGAYDVRDAGDGHVRPSRPGDVMVLARRLTQIHHLEHALEEAGLRFTTEGGKSFFDRQEVHELIGVLRAVDDPADRVSVVAALRSSLFAVTDRDIVCFALSGGVLRIGDVQSSEIPGSAAVAPALACLHDLHRERTRLSPAALIERLYDETRIEAALTGTRRGSAQTANLEKVVAMARQAEGLGVLTLRGFIRYLDARIRERSDEPDLPSTRPGDPQTIRVLSIHKAKGLEAPMVVLFDSADDARSSPTAVPLWDEGKIAIGFRKGCQPPGWDGLRAADERRGQAEVRRLLYVACTRARDYLVIPVPPSDAQPGDLWKTLVQSLPTSSDADVQVVDADTLAEPEPHAAPFDFRALAGATGGDPVAARWESERKERIEAASARALAPISATRHAARTSPPPVPIPESIGGRDFGSLVHQILEWLPLDQPEAAAAMAASLAPAQGLDAADAARAAEAVRKTLSLPVMQRARAARQLWRELPVWLPQEGELLEGVVDLVFEEEGGLVVVDYKTDPIAPAQAIDQAAHHAEQLRLYGRALTQATGLGVRERLVLFTAIGQAVAV